MLAERRRRLRQCRSRSAFSLPCLSQSGSSDSGRSPGGENTSATGKSTREDGAQRPGAASATAIAAPIATPASSGTTWQPTGNVTPPASPVASARKAINQAAAHAVDLEGPQVFIAHAGEQKQEFVDVLRVLLSDMHALDVFVDEWSLRPDDDALPVIQHNLRAAAVVVVVLSRHFVRKEYPMKEVRQIMTQREAGSGQRLCIVLHDITYEECSQHVLREYAADLEKLLDITALRPDQARHFHGVEALRAVDVVVALLVAAGQLPDDYGAANCNQLPRPPPLLGRERVLSRVQEALQRERLLIVVGGPGEGKSAVAAEAAHRMSDAHLLPGGIFAVDLAATTATAAGGKMALSGHIADQLAAACSTVKGAWRLATEGSWKQMLLWLRRSCKPLLVVLENAEHALHDPSSSKTLLELVGEMHGCLRVTMVITSRVMPVCQHVLLTLPPLDADSAVSLLLRHCGLQTDALHADGASRLAQLCSCNALLLRVLGTMLATNNLPLEDVLKTAEAGGPLSVQQGGPRRDLDIGRVFAWITDHLQPAQLQALCALSLFRGSFSKDAAMAMLQQGTVPAATILSRVTQQLQRMRRTSSDEAGGPEQQARDKASALLQDLADASLLALASPASARVHRFALHPLVWDFAGRARRAQPWAQQLAAFEAFLAWMLAFGHRLAQSQPGGGSPAEVVAVTQLLADELPNVGALAAQLNSPALASAVQTEHKLSRLEALAGTLQLFGQCTAAAKLLRPVFAARQRLQGPAHPATLNSGNMLAVELLRLGQYTEGARMLRRLLRLSEVALGREHPGTLLIMSNIAEQLRWEGRMAEAAAQYRATWELQRRVLGKDHPDTLCSLEGMATAQGELGRDADALHVHTQVLTARQAALGPQHRRTLASLQSVADQLEQLGRRAEAVEHHRSVLRCMQRVDGSAHHDSVGAAARLAQALWRLGRRAEAQTLLQQMLDVQRRRTGPEDPHTLSATRSLTRALSEMGEHEQAATQLRAMVVGMVRVHGPEHPDTLDGMYDLARQVGKLGDHAGSLEQHRRVLALRQKSLSLRHPHTLCSMHQIAIQLGRLGQHAEAAALHQRVLQAAQRVLGCRHPDTLGAMQETAEQLAALAEQPEAAQQYWQALQAVMQDYPEPCKQLETAASSDADALADELHGLGLHAEAAAQQQDLSHAVPSSSQPEQPVALASLAALAEQHASLGRPEQAAQVLQQALPLMRRELGPGDPLTLRSAASLARQLCQLGQLAEAAEQLEDARQGAVLQLQAEEGNVQEELPPGDARAGSTDS